MTTHWLCSICDIDDYRCMWYSIQCIHAWQLQLHSYNHWTVELWEFFSDRNGLKKRPAWWNGQGSSTGPVRSSFRWRQLCLWSWLRCWRCWNAVRSSEGREVLKAMEIVVDPEDFFDLTFFFSETCDGSSENRCFIDFEMIGCLILFVYFQKTVSMKEVTSTIQKTTRGFHQQELFISPEIVMRIEMDRTKQIMVWVIFFETTTRPISDLDRWYRAQDSRSNTEPIEECSARSVSRRRFKSIDQSSRAMPWLCHQRQVM